MADRIADIWGARTPHAKDTPWPVRVDMHLDQGLAEPDVDRWVQSACVLCSNGCGCDIAVKDGRVVGIRGRAGDVVNHGRLGPKGLYGSWRRDDADRLTRPLVRRGGVLEESDWDTAMDGEEPDVQQHTCQVLAERVKRQSAALTPIVERYGEHREREPERLHATGLESTRSGAVGLLRDLQDLYTLANLTDITWTVVGQAAQGLRDRELLDVVSSCEKDTDRQLAWLCTRIKQAAPQALIAAG